MTANLPDKLFDKHPVETGDFQIATILIEHDYRARSQGGITKEKLVAAQPSHLFTRSVESSSQSYTHSYSYKCTVRSRTTAGLALHGAVALCTFSTRRSVAVRGALSKSPTSSDHMNTSAQSRLVL